MATVKIEPLPEFHAGQDLKPWEERRAEGKMLRHKVAALGGRQAGLVKPGDHKAGCALERCAGLRYRPNDVVSKLLLKSWNTWLNVLTPTSNGC